MFRAAREKCEWIIQLRAAESTLHNLARFGGQEATPNLDAFVHEADLVTGATPPAAGTYFIAGGDRFHDAGRDLRVPVTAEDESPTLLDLLKFKGNPLGSSGISLAP
jgi:hypothetical protein